MDTLYIILAILMSAFVLYQESRYRVAQGFQVVVVQLGEVFGEARTQPGVYFKIPFLQKVSYYPREAQISTHTHEIPAGKNNVVSLSIRVTWKIEDIVKFHERVHVFDENSREFLESKIRETERKVFAAAKRGDLVFKSSDPATGELRCNPEILREIQEKVQVDLFDFGILLTDTTAAVSR